MAGKHSLEKAREETEIPQKIESGEVSNYYETEKQLESEVKVSPEKDATSKVIDFDEAERKDSIVFHASGYSTSFGDERMIAGILNAEQILKQGILAQDIRERAKILASKFGHRPEHPFMNTREGISTYEVKQFRHGWTGGLGDIKKGKVGGRELAFIVKKKSRGRISVREDDDPGEFTIKRRAKPKDILGLYSKGYDLNKNIRELLFEAEPQMRFLEQIMQVAQNLGIKADIVDRQISLIKQYEQEWEARRQPIISEERSMYDGIGWGRERDRGLKELKENRRYKELHDKLGSLAGFYQKKIHEQIQIAKQKILPLIFEQERFTHIQTVGDYLVYLGKNSEFLFNINEKLYWPQEEFAAKENSR